MRFALPPFLILAMTAGNAKLAVADQTRHDDLPANLQVVLQNTKPLRFPRGRRLPLFVLPITNSLAGVDNARAEAVLRELDRRGIGYTVDWNPSEFEISLAEGLRIGTLQKRLGLRVAVNANACLYSFFDGSQKTLHVDGVGEPSRKRPLVAAWDVRLALNTVVQP